MQNAELEAVKHKIRSLAAKTISNGCTEAEALSAAEMVGKLLDRYSLSMSEVQMRAEPCVTKAVNTDGKSRRSVDFCIVAIANFCDCRVWFSRGNPVSKYMFFGMEADTELAAYLFSAIDSAMKSETNRFKQSDDFIGGKSATTSFQRGMANRISQRLNEMKKTRANQHTSTGTSLVVVKSQIVETAFRESGTKLTTHYNNSRKVDLSSYQKGRAAGDRVNLNNPLQHSARRQVA